MYISAVVHPRLGTIWTWKDFGDIGGNVIAFIQRYCGLSERDVSGALRKLEDLGFKWAGHKAPSPTRGMHLVNLNRLRTPLPLLGLATYHFRNRE